MKKKIWLLVIAVEILGIAFQGYSVYEYHTKNEETVRRGETKQSETYLVTGKEETMPIELTIPGERLTAKQRKSCLQKATEEIDASFLKENTSLEQITGAVEMRESYADGKVQAQWEMNPSGIFKRDGTIRYKEVTEDTLVNITAVLSCEQEVSEYDFAVVVKEPGMETAEGFAYLVSSVFQKEEESTEGRDVPLPQEVEGVRLSWRRPMDFTGLQICLLGIAGFLILRFGTEFDEKKEKEKKRDAYLGNYAEIVSGLVLYVGAGMSVRNAFERMGDTYLLQRKKKEVKEKPAYENMVRMNRRLKDGQMEHKVYEDFGRECMHPVYTKLALMLNQNSRKGNRKLLTQLEKEEQNLYEERQRRLKIAGEKISTKLLLPMGGLLLMVLIIIIVPAFGSMSL